MVTGGLHVYTEASKDYNNNNVHVHCSYRQFTQINTLQDPKWSNYLKAEINSQLQHWKYMLFINPTGWRQLVATCIDKQLN